MPRAKIHYAWIVALVTFVVILVTAGIRATPGVLMVPLESELGWSRTVISMAVAINIALFGLIGPFAAAVMDRWGLRRVILAAVALLAVSVALTTRMHTQWELMLLWGLLVGTGTGVTSMVLAAIVATRWFDARRGVVLGVLSAANATGQLVFLPLLARLVEQRGWRAAALLVAGASVVVFAIVFLFMRDRPEDLGLRPYGQAADHTAPTARPWAPIEALGKAARKPAFWILGGTFFVCGASTNGLIGTHLIAACHDYGLDWIATVPPTVRLTSDAFGRENTGVVYGWIGASHQIGASIAAFGAGYIRTSAGDYSASFWIAGVLCVLAGLSFLTLGRKVFSPRVAIGTLAPTVGA